MTPVLLVALAFAPARVASAQTLRIDNPARAPRTEVVRLEALWSVGGDDSEIFFGNVSGTLVDRDGRVYVADSQAKEISVFSADGEFLRHLGREGEGPGEFQEPRSPVLMPDGNIGVVYEQPPRIICFRASDGEFVEDVHLAQDPEHPFQRLSRVVCRGKTLVAYAADITQDSNALRVTGRVMRFDAAGRFLGECDSLGFTFNFAKPVVRERHDIILAVGPDERVYVNRERDYDITVHGRDCAVQREIVRDYKPVKRSSAEVDSLRAFYQRVGNIGDSKLEILDTVRDIAWMSVDDDGLLWVLSSRGRLDLPVDSLGVFDVFDANGRLDRTVDLKAERGANDAYHMDGDRFYVIRRDTMTIVAHRMPELTRQ